MGGKKHHLWGQMIPGYHKDFNSIPNPIDRHIAFVSHTQEPFCQLCGKPIIMSSVDEHGGRVDWEEEMRFQVHTKCLQAERARRIEEKQESLEEIIRRQYGVEVKSLE